MPIWIFSLLGGIKDFFVAALTFLLTVPGIYIFAVLLVCGAWWWSGGRGYENGYSECTAYHERLVAIEKARQLKVFSEVVARSEQEGNHATVIHDTNTRIIERTIGAANARPNANSVCVDADLADQLRQIK